MDGDTVIYITLFWNAFIAATLLPAFSEAALAGLLAGGQGLPFYLFLAATTGNTAGACINWWLGCRILDFQGRRWFPFKPAQIDRASRHFERYGRWSLLMAWLPVVGDPLTLIAGVLRTPFLLFLGLVAIGKAMRYGAILLLYFYA